MKSYGNQFNLKKKFPNRSQKNFENTSIFDIKLIHQIFDTVNTSLLVLIVVLFFLSFDSQKKWSNTYKTLSKTRAINNNLIESLNIYRKTKPDDLIYLDKIFEKKESFFKKSLSSFIEGFNNSEYQRGY